MRNNKKIYIPDYMIVLRQLDINQTKKMSKLLLETNITYNHLFEIKKELVLEGLVTIFVDGQTHNIKLTEKGERLKIIIRNLIFELGFTDDDIKEIRLSMKHKEHKKKEPIESKSLNSDVTLNNNINEESII